MNVDDAMRRFRASIPGPSDALVMRIVESTTSGVHRSPRRRHVSSRTVLVTATVMTALVVIVALGFLIRGGAGPSAAPAAPAIPPARVDWGMVATVRLKPDPGISIDEMRERFTTALAFRVHDDDGAGVEVLSASGDAVTVRLPGAEDANWQAKPFLTFGRILIFDDESSVIASGPDLRSLEADAKRLTTSGTPLVYYVQSNLRPGLGWSGPERIASRATAEGRLRDHGGGQAVMIAVPADLAVVGGGDGSDVSLIRPTQVVPSSAVRAVRMEGDAAIIAIDPAHRPDHDRRVRVFVSIPKAGDAGNASIDVLPGANAAPVGAGTLTTSGDLRVENAQIGESIVGRPDLGGRVETIATRAYGTRPPEPGTEYAPRGARVVAGLGVPVGTKWIRLVGAAFDGKEHVLIGATHDGALFGVGTHVLGEKTYPDGRWGLAGFGGSKTDPCPVGVGTPRVTSCGPMGFADPPRDGKVRVTYRNYGRVRPGVQRVRVHFQGSVQDAVIENGWWLASVSVEVPEIKDDPTGIQAVGATGWVRVTAADAEGNEFTVPTRFAGAVTGVSPAP